LAKFILNVKRIGLVALVLASACAASGAGSSGTVYATSAHAESTRPDVEENRRDGEATVLFPALEVAPEGEMAAVTGHCDGHGVAMGGGSPALARAACDADLAMERDIAHGSRSATGRTQRLAREDHLAGRVDAARRGYAHAVERDGEHALTSRVDRGLLRFESGDEAGALEDFAWVLAHDPPPTVRGAALHNVALVQLQRGELDEALASARRAGKLLARELGPGHASVAHVQHTLGVIHAERGDPDLAAEHLARAVVLRRASLGDAHPHTAASRSSLGVALSQLDRWEDALAEHRAALAIDERVLGPDHPVTAVDHAHVGSALLALGHREEAHTSFETATAILRRYRSTEDPELQRLEQWLARTQHDG
jgi:tetratricopeptide (TPR) repeat protein